MKREYIAIPMVLFVLAYGLCIYWAATSGSAAAWIVLVVLSFVLAVAIVGAIAKRSRAASRAEPLEPAAAVDDGAYRVLVVVDDGGTSAAFRRSLLDSAMGRTAKALVIATSAASGLDRLTGDQSALDAEQAKLDATVRALVAVGIGAEGRIGSHDPVQAVTDGLREFPADAVVLGTHADTTGGWLEDGVIEAAQKRATVPVSHVVITGD